MFIKRTTTRIGGKTYVNHLLVESVATPKGPRHRVICSLGKLAPAPPQEWLGLARKIEAALAGQATLVPEATVEVLAARARDRRAPSAGAAEAGDLLAIQGDRISLEEAREAGPVHVGHQMWRRLGVDAVLAQAGLSARTRQLTEVMTLGRLVSPGSEHATPDWLRRTALPDLLGGGVARIGDDALYRNLDRLHPKRAAIEQGLAERERTLFNLDESIYLYDLTSTYFEGRALANSQAQRGYSRDGRPDCKQVVVGLVLDRDGFPKAHEVFDGNKTDGTTLEGMLAILQARTGGAGGATVVVDRGMAFAANLEQIRQAHHHYIVASRPGERGEHLGEFEDETGWREIARPTSPRNPSQHKTRVELKRLRAGDEVRILCRSDGREQKDRAIREAHESRFLRDVQKLGERVARGRLRDAGKIQQAIGRLRERYPRVARYYEIAFDAAGPAVRWSERADRAGSARRLDGSYILKTDRADLSDEEIWRTYMLLTRVEAAFRSMKSPLAERPIFHQLKDRVRTHIFLCVLAYHLLVAIEQTCREAGLHTSWETLRAQLSTHQVVTVALPTSRGAILKIRKGSTPEPVHKEIYRTLGIPEEVMKPVRTRQAP
ncbi:MAG: IS1634 family transposase [Chloroflexi bacterium]|nr:IS1634 family transposase [Chloroflexota bacterium]